MINVQKTVTYHNGITVPSIDTVPIRRLPRIRPRPFLRH